MSDPRPTICQVLFTLQMGGAEVLAARMAERLAGDFRFVFACLDGVGPAGERLRAGGFPVHHLGRRPGGLDWRCARRLGGLLRAERVDVVHAHQHGPFLYSLTARLPRRRPPIVFTEHGRYHPDLPARRRMALNRLLLGRRDRLVGVGRGVGQALVDNEGLPARRVEVIYNGIPTEKFSGGRGDRAAVRGELGVGPDDLVLLHVARLDPIKDHATAVRAVGRVARARPDVRLVLAGGGPEEEAVGALVRREGLGPHVLALGPRDDVPRLLAAADLVMLTSFKEGVPLSLLEGMAAGLPVVATRVGGIPEVVDEGRTGLLAPPGDDAALAEAVLRLAADPALRERMGRAGRERAEGLFSEGRMHAAYARIYRELGPRAGGRVPSSAADV